MADIINEAAELGLMLPKSRSMLYENIREFYVADRHLEAGPAGQAHDYAANRASVHDSASDGPDIVGVCGLSVIWANLAEVVSLVVSPTMRGRGLGKRLVDACLEDAKRLGVRRVMSLTYEQVFFERLGFAVVDRQQLPLKVWADCVRCPKNEACDEIAMIREFDEIPEPFVGRDPAPAMSSGQVGGAGGGEGCPTRCRWC